MGQVSTLTNLFSELGSAIRIKGSLSTSFTPYEMPAAIKNLDSYVVSSGVNPYLINQTITNYVNASITNLSTSIFSNNSQLWRVHLPNCYAINTSYAFAQCSALSWIQLPSVTAINYSAWLYRCSALSSISLPLLGRIPKSQGCYAIQSYYAPAAVTIEYAAFQYCYSLTTLSTNSLQSIGSYACNLCYKLSFANIGNGASVEAYAFEGCSQLQIADMLDFENCYYSLSDSCFMGAGRSGSNYSFSYSSLALSSGCYYWPFGQISSNYRFPNLRHLQISSISCVHMFPGCSFDDVTITGSRTWAGFLYNDISLLTAGPVSLLTLESCSIDSLVLTGDWGNTNITLSNTSISSIVCNDFTFNEARIYYMNMYNFSSYITVYYFLGFSNAYCYANGLYQPLTFSISSGVDASHYINIEYCDSLYSISLTIDSNIIYSSRITYMWLQSCPSLRTISISCSQDTWFSLSRTPASVMADTNLLDDGIYVPSYTKAYSILTSWASGTALRSHIYSY